ncbi:ankyrin repeat domain-containing protein [Treponema rectale]|uniref:Ankyrin repeat domain-containing protein n=2 Tax=Treponema rectale TaxID=744512 RepID=A0A7M1XMT9_9SPIR|nr:ankyrin repeat domain-containing protein [Treponema rectale]
MMQRLIVLLAVFSLVSCNRKMSVTYDVDEYRVSLLEGNLKTVELYYRKFGKIALEDFGYEKLKMYNPLEVALVGKNYDIADFLIAKGTDVNAKTPSGLGNIIHTFAYREEPENIQYLISKGAQTKNLNPPLGIIICSSSNMELIKLMADGAIDINEKDEDGETPLYTACGYGNLQVVKFLVEHGADINSRTNENATPFLISVCRGNIEVAEYLILQGADTTVADLEGYDALWCANELGIRIKGLNDSY